MIVLTTFETDERVFDALQAGAAGFLMKDAEPADMLRAVRLAAAGESLLSPVGDAARDRLVQRGAARPYGARTTGWAQLTEREREVLALMGEGLSNDEIGGRAGGQPGRSRRGRR